MVEAFKTGVIKEIPVSNKLVAAASEYQLTVPLVTKAFKVRELLSQARAPVTCKFKSIMLRWLIIIKESFPYWLLVISLIV